MRINFLIILAVLVTAVVQAQPWTNNLPTGKSPSELTLFDYQRAFEAYWAPYKVDKGTYVENGIKKKAPGWKQFKRWEYQMSSLIDPLTGALPKKTATQVVEEFNGSYSRSSVTNAAEWIPLGPVTSFSGYSGIGRLNCVAFHPTDLNTYWVGAAAGGLWMTSDNGSTWTCQTDNNGVLAVSDIIIPEDYATTNTIYIATGDRDGWDNRSIGVLKSTDGGNTWNPTGLSFTIFEGRMVNRLLIDPSNPDILIAATTIGVFKTFDGGATWNTQMTPFEFIDMEFRPGNPNVVYGSTKNGKIYVSTDGSTFGPAVFNDNSADRIELAVSPNQPDWVYALAANGNSGLYGIFKSSDSGVSFNQVFSGESLNLLTWESDGSGTGGQGWYDLSLAASPFDANILLVGGVNSWRSFDGGENWAIANHWYGDMVQAVHADKHKLAFRDNGDLFECSDGGIYFSQDNGGSWADKTNGIQISQMYRLSVSQNTGDDVITGLQDNGTKLHSGNAWFDVLGGDGMECLVDYTDANIQYGSLYFGAIDRTTNHWLSSSNITPPDEGAWVTPYIIDPTDPAILYGGYNEVWKTVDRGDNWTQLTFLGLPGKILSMAIAPSDANYLYIANHNQMWKTTNGGTDWTPVTNTLPTGSANIEYITVKHDDPNTVWVALSGYSNPGVYHSVDGGTSWTNISAGLPPIPAYSVVQNKQSAAGLHLYLGTELGVYFKDGENDWVPYSNGLPNVRIGEIEIYYAGNPGESKLRAASYGRGLWETPIEYLPTPMIYASSTATQQNKSAVAPDQINQEILKVEVTTNGNLMPFNVTSFTFNTNGTTNPGHDITNARLFYSGASNLFSTAVQFGNAIASPSGEFIIEGTQQLNDGRNNFWLTYDLPSTALLGNLLDAECTSLMAGEERSLLVTAPEGNRTIGYEYCISGAAQMTYEYISNVTMGVVNQHSEKGAGGYEDYTSQVIDMVIGSPMQVLVENGSPYFSDVVLIWVDWNIDGDFDDPGEQVFVSGPSGSSYFDASFAPPPSAIEGITRMRIRLHDSENGPHADPCGYATWGEVEDYSIRVSAADPCSELSYLDYKAQSIPGDYEPLGMDGTLITTTEFDNANSTPQDIGFTFEFACTPFTQFVLNTNGFIKLGDTPPSSAALFFDDPRDTRGGIFNNNDPADVNLICPLNLDLDAGTGTPEYRVYTSGSAPDRICTIQYQDVREAGTDPIPQFDDMQFQIKLYETSNIIEFVYGDWIASDNEHDFRAVACGLKGSSRSGNQVLIAGKEVLQPWDEVSFANANYAFTSAIFYAKSPESPKPDAGRTLRFIPRYNNDLSITEIYTLGDASLYYSRPQTISVHLENAGNNELTDIPVTLTITGDNAFEETKYIPALGFQESLNISFSDFIPSANGLTGITISLPDDQDNLNNALTWEQYTNDFNCNYASLSPPARSWGVPGGKGGIFYSKYHISSTASADAVYVYIADDTASIGQAVSGILLNHEGAISAQSDAYSIDINDLGTWHSFYFNTPYTATDEDIYVGFSVSASGNEYAPLGVQNENPLRPETFYQSLADGSELTAFTFPFRFMIGAMLSPTPPAPGEVSAISPVCIGDSSTLSLTGSSGSIQWQESVDGITNWTDVSGGSEASLPYYTTQALTSSVYYRAAVSQPGFATVYSNAIFVEVIPVTPVITASGDVLISSAVSGNQWYDENGMIPGATGQLYLALIPGTYYVIISSGNCTSLPSNIIALLTVATNEPNPASRVKLYPNPVRNELIIDPDGNNSNLEFEIINALGHVSTKGKTNGRMEVATADFLPGIYFIQLKGEGFTETRKFVKE